MSFNEAARRLFRNLAHPRHWWIAIPLILVTGSALANYAATQGAGTNFASVVLGGTVHYFANMLCDFTTGQTQCASVNASGQVGITGPVTPGAAWPVRLQDGSGNSIGSTTGSLNINCTAGCTSTGGTSSNFNNTFPTPGTAIGVKNGANMVNLTADGSNNLNVDIAAGLLPPGNTTMSASTPVTWASDQTPVKASTTGNIAANNTTGVPLKGSAGYVTSIQLGGIGSAPAYLKLYNKATAPTCGTDTPVKRLIIPAAATAANGAGSNIAFPAGIFFSLGIGYCVTTGILDTDTTAPPANTYLVNIDWQ